MGLMVEQLTGEQMVYKIVQDFEGGLKFANIYRDHSARQRREDPDLWVVAYTPLVPIRTKRAGSSLFAFATLESAQTTIRVLGWTFYKSKFRFNDQNRTRNNSL